MSSYSQKKSLSILILWILIDIYDNRWRNDYLIENDLQIETPIATKITK